MYRKISIKTLAIIFTVLLLIVAVVKINDSLNKGNTLKDVLFTVNTADVTAIKIYPHSEKGREISLMKSSDKWMVKFNDKTFKGDQKLIKSLIDQINGLKPLRLAAAKSDKWKKFEVTDSLATRVELEKDGKTLAGIYLGKFSYIQPKQQMKQQNPYMQQPQGTMITYVRVPGEDNVYAVEGFLAMSFNRDGNSFRDKVITDVNKNELTKLTFTYPSDSSFVLSKKDSHWFVDDKLADSTLVVNYLNGTAHLSGRTFSENANTAFTHSVKIEGNNMEPVIVQAVMNDKEDALINSTLNKEAVFKDNNMSMFKKLFVSKQKLFK